MPEPITNRKQIDEIIEVADEVLTAWERNFIEKLSELENVESLTEKQSIKLEQIYAKVCDSPY